MGPLVAFRGKVERLTAGVVFGRGPIKPIWIIMVLDFRIFIVMDRQYLLILVVTDETFTQQRFIYIFETKAFLDIKYFVLAICNFLSMPSNNCSSDVVR